MIKFFRKIRQRLIREGRLSSYLAYALGEIVLVVIGILIALQLNNWNNAQQLAQEELKLLVEMRHNLSTDLEDCAWNIEKQESMMRSNNVVLDHLNSALPFHDSLLFHYGNLFYSTTQRRNMAAYDHLKSKGIDLIQNDSLRRNITALYSERYYYIERQELEYDNAFQLSEVVPQVNAKLYVEEKSNSAYPLDLSELREDETFKGTLRMNRKIRLHMANRYKSLAIDLEELISLIDKELENRE
jgi:hypothetical protein